MSTPLPLLDVSEIHTAYGLSRVLFGVSIIVFSLIHITPGDSAERWQQARAEARA